MTGLDMNDIEGICLVAGAYLGGPPETDDPGIGCQLNLNASLENKCRYGLLELGRIPAKVDHI